MESQEGVREYKVTRHRTWPPRPHVALDTCQLIFPTMKLYNRENVSAHVLMPAGIETVGGVAHAANFFLKNFLGLAQPSACTTPVIDPFGQ